MEKICQNPNRKYFIKLRKGQPRLGQDNAGKGPVCIGPTGLGYPKGFGIKNTLSFTQNYIQIILRDIAKDVL